MSSVEPLPLPVPQGQATTGGREVQESAPDTPAFLGRVVGSIGRRRRSRNGHRPVSPSALNEELAVALLYGRRSGSVTASPARPPR